MLILVLAYCGGILTIASPCILPVLPFVLARAQRPFRSSGLPMLLGMATTFALVGTLAAVGGGWAVRANQYGRMAAMVLLAVMGVALLSPRVAAWLSRPFVAAGQRLSTRNQAERGSPLAAAGLGVATGLLWTPCAGPILGLLLTAAALSGASVQTTLLLLTFAAGAVTSLAFALLLGGHALAAMKRTLPAGEWLRRGLGALVLVGVAAIASGLDTGLLARLSLATTGPLEQRLVEALQGRPTGESPPPLPGRPLPDEGPMPSLAGATGWLNGPPLGTASLRGSTVLVDFWTYSCINCLRTLPYVGAWAEKYRDHGLVVIGVHSPEFAFEKDPANVARAVERLGIGYPVALDNDFAIWRGFRNRYWPAHYFIDVRGRIRHRHFGEGDYAQSEDVIRRLLAEAGASGLPGGYVRDTRSGAAIEASGDLTRTHETYLGHARAGNFGGGRLVNNAAHDYVAPPALRPHQWALDGRWVVQPEHSRLDAPGGAISYRFRGRDVNLVLAPPADGRPVRFRITLDGRAPGADHGVDADADGYGVVSEDRLYQLVRQSSGSDERVFRITFLDPGVRAYAFTFG